MPSSATLTTLRDRVEQILQDTGNNIWSTDVLDEAIRQALHEYSKVNPQRVIGTVNLSSDTREIDISSLTGLLDVSRLWLPYDSSDPEHPPNWRRFEHWRDEELLYLPDDDEGASGEVARVFYTKLQTLNGLDSASATTFPADDETIIATGGAGYAATSRAIDLVEKVTLDRLSSQQVRAWGLGKLQEYRSALKTVARHAALRGSAFVPSADLDRWEKRDSRWG